MYTTTISINYTVDRYLTKQLFKFSINEIYCDCIDDWLPLAYSDGIYNFMLTIYINTIRSSVSPVWLVSRS